MTLDYVQTGILLAVLIAATVIDTRQHRLPNVLTVSAALLGISLQCVLQGWSGLLNSLTGFFTALLLFLPFYAARWMGAGDVKLMAAVGTFLGWPDSLLAVCLTTGAGSVAAFVLLAAQGGLVDYVSRYGLMAKYLLFTGIFTYLPPKTGEASTQVFPYALAIGLGTIATLVWVGRLDVYLKMLAGLFHA